MSQVNIPPFSEEAENAILGAIIDKPSLLDNVSSYLSPDIFYIERNRRLYIIICDMMKNGEPIDLVTLTGRLSKADQDKGITPYYISGLTENLGTDAMSHRYAV